jgi:hypothetical protein
MLSPQQANWGVKTGYFFAGTAFFGGIILYFQMPEVSITDRGDHTLTHQSLTGIPVQRT